MIRILFFVSIAFLVAKDFIFFLDCTFIGSFCLFMLLIIPLTSFFLSFSLFKRRIKIDRIIVNIVLIAPLIFCGASFFFKDSFMFLIFIELSVIPIAYSILNFSKDKDKFHSAIFILFINISGSVPFMYFRRLNNRVENFFMYPLSRLSLVLLFCFFLVLICKLPVFLAHFWLTKAHVSASGLTSILLASVMLKLGSFGLLKFSSLFFISSRIFISFSVRLSMVGMLIFSFVMVRFFDSKFLIACSSVVHIAFIWPFCLMLPYVNSTSTIFIMTGHGLVSYILFYLVSIIYEADHSRSVVVNKCLEAHSKTGAMLFFLFVLLNLGVPPFIGFLSEFLYCSFLHTYRLLALFFFCLFIIFCIFFVIIFLRKLLFGKKLLLSFNRMQQYSLFYCFPFLIYIFFLPFYLCSISFIKNITLW